MENKRGFTTIALIGVIFIGIVVMMILGVTVFTADRFDQAFSQVDIDFGNNITFNETYQNTLQPGITAMKTTVPQIMSTGILLGMILCMMFVAYNTPKIGRLWLILDIALIIVAEMAASLVISSFTTYINSNPQFLQIYSTTLSLGAKYILNLHIIIPTLGVILMIVTHLLEKKPSEETF